MPSIDFTFRAHGFDGVRSAIRGIRTEAETTEKSFARMERTFRQSQQAQTRTARQRNAAVATVDREADQEYRSKVKEREHLAKQVAKTQERQSRDETRVKAREEAQRDRDYKKTVTERDKAAKRVAADQERADRQTAQKRVAEEKKALDQASQAGKRHARERSEIEKRVARDRKQIEEEGLRSAKQHGKSRAQEEIKLAAERKRLREDNRVFKDVGGELKGFAIGAAATTIAAGVGVTTVAARQALQLRETVNRLSISARGAGQEAVDPAELQREFQQTAARTPGIKAADVAAAVQGFVTKTGRLDVARQQQQVFATVASATGGRVEDIADAAADLFQKFDITSMEDMADAMAALAFQGKAGAFELKDAASQFARLSSAASRFGLGKGQQSVRVLGGLTQIARSATGSPEQAATAIEAMFRQFTAASTQKEFRKLGVQVFKDKGKTQARDIRDLLVDTISKSQGNLTTLGHIFGEEGIRGISPLISTFNQAKEQAKTTGVKGEAEQTAYAIAALRKALSDAIDAPGDYAELQKDAAQAQQDASAKLTAAWEKIVSGVGDKVIPIVAQFADTLANSDGSIDAFVGTVEILAQAFMGLVMATGDLLEFMGLATKKVKTPEQVRDDERKRAQSLIKQLESFDKRRGGSWEEEKKLRAVGKTKEANEMAKRLMATPELDEERAAIVGKLDVSKRKVGEANALIESKSQEFTKGFDQQTFAKKYLELGGAGGMQGKAAEEYAQRIAQGIQAAPLGKEATAGAFAGESAEATKFRQEQGQFRQQERLQYTGTMTDETAGKAQTGIAEFLANLKKASAALGGIAAANSPSVIAGT